MISTPKCPPLFAPLALLALCALALFFSCKKNRVEALTAPARPAATPRPAEQLLGRLRERQTADSWDRLYARADVFADGVSASAQIVWVRDSAIWIQVKKLGVEAARILVTPDSLWAINRIDRVYTAQSMIRIADEYRLPGGFDLIQNLLLGRAAIADTSGEWRSDIRDEMHRVFRREDGRLTEYYLEEGPLTLRRAAFSDLSRAAQASVMFGAYLRKSKAVGLFPYSRTLYAYSGQTGELRMDMQFTELAPGAYRPIRFEIPAHYERME
ncbi:MAG: DUF4292 domain-containing protein [Saprospiraceae bacterium]